VKSLERWIIYPFLFSLYPILALLAENISEVSIFSAVRVILLTLIFACILLLGFGFLLKNRFRSALAATFSLLIVFLYGHIYNLVKNTAFDGIVIGRHRYLVPIWILFLIIGLWACIKKVKSPHLWALPLNVISIITLIFPITQIAYHEFRSYMLTRYTSVSNTNPMVDQPLTPISEAHPDIYYIILDTYTRGDTLRERFNYDNSAFLDGLEQRGFYIATCSQSNYSFTEASLTSSLNMQYLQDLDARFTPPNQAIEDMAPYLKTSATIEALKSLGYKIVAFESGYGPTEFRNADIYFSPKNNISETQVLSGLNPFEIMLLRTTIVRFFIDSGLLPTGLENSLFDPAYQLYRQRILYEFDSVPDVASLSGPKFTFIHILAPHNPFVFGPNGEFLSRTVPFTLNNDMDAFTLPDYIKGYVGEVAYIDQRILQAVDAILTESSTPPIIIIQGDHGSPQTPGWNDTILNAYYFPTAQGKSLLYSSISPVNSFRVVFNSYFGGHLELLSDKACTSSSDNPYDCLVLTDPDPQCNAIKP
jgi:hypothetical protein